MIFNTEKESVTLALGSFIVFLQGVMFRIPNICSYYDLLQTRATNCYCDQSILKQEILSKTIKLRTDFQLKVSLR